MKTGKNVLVALDDERFCGPVLRAFQSSNHIAIVAPNVDMAVECIKRGLKGKIDAVICAGRSHGVEFAGRIVPVAENVGISPVIIVTKFTHEYRERYDGHNAVIVVSNCAQGFADRILNII